MSDVFISYSRGNIDFAERLFESLKTRGMSAWVDWQDIPRSAGWWDEIKRGIDAATTFIFLVSNDSLSSAVCTLELAHAQANGKRIIPVIIQQPDFDAPIPVRPQDALFQQMLSGRDLFAMVRELRTLLRERNWMLFISEDGASRPFDEALGELLDTLKTDLAHNYRHARLLVQAREWENSGHDDDLLLIGDEISQAEAWLAETEIRGKEPTSTDLHREYIMTSRRVEDARMRRLRNIQRTSIVASLVAVAMIIVAIITSTIATNAMNEVVHAQSTATQIPPTLTQAAILLQEAFEEQIIVSEFTDAIRSGINSEVYLVGQMNNLVAKFPDNPSAYNARGNAYASLGKTELAINDYNQAIAINPMFAKAYNNRGLAYADIENMERAIEDYNQAIIINPAYADAYNNRGNIYYTLDDYEQAINDYNQAIVLDPSFAKAYNNRGNAYRDLKNYGQAIANFEWAIALDPAYAYAYNNRGIAYAELGEFENAIADYNQAITLDSEFAKAYSNRGNAYSNMGEYERAIADYIQAIELDPTLAAGYYNRGITYTKLREYSSAIRDYNQAIALDPEYVEAYLNRGITHMLLGNNEVDSNSKLEYFQHALTDWRRAEALGLELPPEIQDTMSQIETALPTPTPMP